MATLTLLLTLLSARPQPAPLALDRLQGSWTGTGQVSGQPAKAELQFERVLGGKFTRLRYAFGEDVNGTFVLKFEGHAYYAACPTGEGCGGQWFDTLGFTRKIAATQSSEVLVSEWSTAGSEAGKSEYRFRADGSLVVTDFVRSADGSFREFGRISYTRAK